MFAFRRFLPVVAPSLAARAAAVSALPSHTAVAAAACMVPACAQIARSCATTTTTSTRNNNNRRSDNNNNYRRDDRNRNNNRDRNNRDGNRDGNPRRPNSDNYRGDVNRSASSNRVSGSRTFAQVEFFDVRDTPAQGRELRLAFLQGGGGGTRNQAKFLTIQMRPQLGPRKTDPHDPTPQFDQANRLSIRLKPKEIATALFWLTGRCSKPSVNIEGRTYKLSLTRLDSGAVAVALAGAKVDGTIGEALTYELLPHQQVQFKGFFEESLFAYWDLTAF